MPPSSAIPTSELIRVRVDGLRKMRPTVRPGRIRSSLRLARSTFSSSARSSAIRSSSGLQSATRVKLLPLRVSGTPAMDSCYFART